MNVPELKIHVEDTGDNLYLCDPEKNTKCHKGFSCGKECIFTKKAMYAKIVDSKKFDHVDISITKDRLINLNLLERGTRSNG